jgi:hypothetical protein
MGVCNGDNRQVSLPTNERQIIPNVIVGKTQHAKSTYHLAKLL